MPSLETSIRRLRSFARRIKLLRHAGTKVECPCCGGRFRRFLPYGMPVREQAECPRCGAMERHRLLWMYLREETELLRARLRVLHLAPEAVFVKLLSALPNLEYVTADRSSPLARHHVDITELPFADGSFDVVICSHVLEHIPDDRKAMSELARVLAPDGWAILLVPIDESRESTFEDFSVTSPTERARLFGQHDHVRWYGRDYPARLEAAGLRVEVGTWDRAYTPEARARWGLPEPQHVFHCTKILA